MTVWWLQVYKFFLRGCNIIKIENYSSFYTDQKCYLLDIDIKSLKNLSFYLTITTLFKRLTLLIL